MTNLIAATLIVVCYFTAYYFTLACKPRFDDAEENGIECKNAIEVGGRR